MKSKLKATLASAGTAIRGTAEQVASSDAVKATTGAIAASATVARSAGAQIGSTVADYACEFPGWTRDAVSRASNSPATAAGFAAAATTAKYVNDFTSNLDFSNVDPTKYLYAGTRHNDKPRARSMEDAEQLWEKIPEEIRMQGEEATLEFLRSNNMHCSHIQPHSGSESNLAANCVWEKGEINQARGAKQMTEEEIDAVQDVLDSGRTRGHAQECSGRCSHRRCGRRGRLPGCSRYWKNSSGFQRHEIDEREMWDAIGTRIARGSRHRSRRHRAAGVGVTSVPVPAAGGSMAAHSRKCARVRHVRVASGRCGDWAVRGCHGQ